jgi:hypothetical protein
MSDGTTEATTTETVAAPVVATPPNPPSPTPAPTTTSQVLPDTLPDDHPLVKAFNATKNELKTFKDAATKAEQEKMLREQRFEELLPQKIEQATTPIKTELENTRKELAKRDKALADLQALYTGLETSVKTSTVQSQVKSAYLSAGPIKEGAEAAFDVIYATHKDKFILDGDTVKVGDQDLPTFFEGLKKAPVYSAMFAGEVKPSGTGTAPNKAVAGANGSGVATIKAGDMKRRNWGSGDSDPLQAIIDGKLVVKNEALE